MAYSVICFHFGRLHRVDVIIADDIHSSRFHVSHATYMRDRIIIY